jgi:hypothetical protein
MHYGQVLVCGNYEGHAQKIADTLNQREFEGVTFEVEEDGRILPDEKWVVCPTAFPYRSWVIPEGGRRILASEFVFRVGEIYSLEYETIPLEDIARLIRPWLARGTIEIVANREWRRRTRLCRNTLRPTDSDRNSQLLFPQSSRHCRSSAK